MFALDDIKRHVESEQDEFYDSLDGCIDISRQPELCSIASLIRGHDHPTKRQKTVHYKPIAFVQLNTRHGKPKPVTVKALLDSGAAGSLVTKEFVKKLRTKKSTQSWSTPSGDLETNTVVKAQFTLPELQDDRLIEWDLHVTDTLGANDMILGRDLLEFLGIDICFSDNTVKWGSSSMPFKDAESAVRDAYYVQDTDSVTDATERMKRILDAKYEAADLDEICRDQQPTLSDEEKEALRRLLYKYEDLFDGTLGKWTGSPVKLSLNKDATPYHARAFPVPRCHLATLKQEVERLCELGVLKKVNRSQWAAPTFLIPKKDGTVRFISDFRELNKRIRRQPYPIPHIQDMLLNLEGFKYATSLDLNMGYYHLELSPESKELCTIVLPFGKFEYQKIPMGLCNSPDIFQEKMDELFDGLSFVRAYIDNLLCLMSGDFEDHLEKVEQILARLQ